MHALIDGLGCGGAEMCLAEFAAIAPAVGVELSVGTLDGARDAMAARRLRSLGVDVTEVAVSGLLRGTDRRRVRRHLEAVAPQLLHTHLGGADFFGGLAARRLGLPAVATIHEVRGPQKPIPALRSALIGWVRRNCFDRVIAVSEAARAAALQRKDAPPDRTVVVPNAVADDPRPGSGPIVRAELGWAREEFVVGMVSALRPEKGHDVAIRAVGMLRARYPRARLLIVGDGAARAEIAAHARSLGDGVRLTGYRDDIMEVLDACDVLLQPSYADAFPTALLQALAASVPIVAADVGGIPEIVSDGRTALLVPAPPSPATVADALETILADDQRGSGLARAGRAHFRSHYSLETWADRLRAIYEEVIVSHRTGPPSPFAGPAATTRAARRPPRARPRWRE